MRKIYISLVLFSSIYSFSQCFTSINGKKNHVTAIKTDGTLWGWGSNSTFALNTTFNTFEAPMQLGIDTNWQKTRSGTNNVFAIKTNGTLWGRGENTRGSLGIGTAAIYSSNLVQIGTASWKEISSASEHSIGIQTNGTLWAWGRNDYNQVGNNTCCNDVLAPVQISTDTDWASIDTSIWGYTMALKTNGTLWGWGMNQGAFGDSGTTSLPVPTQLSTDTDWAEISTLGVQILMLKTNGTLWVFGNGASGELGLGAGVPTTFVPLQLGTATWKSIGGGFFTSFAIKTDDTLWAWGLNDHITGILGLGDTTNRNVPTQIGTDANWAKVICGADHTIAIKNDGTAYAWGLNYSSSTTLGTCPFGDNCNPILLPTAMNGVCAVLENEGFNLGTTVSISPNPAKEQVNIAFSTALQNPSISIVDVTGKTVLTQNNTTLLNNTSMNVAGLSKGLYLVVVKSEGNTSVEKLVVD
ncbi:T9SS type A sorting domain-containing protein [Flavobacterium sp. F372]|uniref:T9SS type A sorting domain-containing protein n=1 Tax=Flavobacterium bernardetii TaxID=2813823 RepID=A0ABR7J2U0_9FLAO|nr:T9SS type A sorting domain-containing protein [Flavobacterium bernardetii]MBC5836277.1 T9SS type A sorting domain-containing protein [Flavobacterium bernardetii]NHF71495.1 T9SS type A sorting domain-containing protein [Flavobacterium bernardetii]